MSDLDLKEYIVTLYRYEDLEGFYEDMETPGGDLYIPNRRVDITLRRPISRNTHYLLTAEEANQLRSDSRVEGVTDNTILIRRRLLYVDESDRWDKTGYPTQSSNDKNWGILRCEMGVQIAGWGTDDTPTQSGIATITSSGKNVDVVIADGLVNRSHTEFLDSSGTSSRYQYYDWYSHSVEVVGSIEESPGIPYPEPNVDEQDNHYCNHGTHVAGTVAGRTFGWARDANIYSIAALSYSYIYNLYEIEEYKNQYGSKFTNWSDYENGAQYVYDYIRAFHKHKPINQETGIKNPTVVNASFGFSNIISRNRIASIVYDGIQYTPENGSSFTDSELDTYGLIYYDANQVEVQGWLPNVAADLHDMIDEGVIIAGAAGNENDKIVSENDSHYNNRLILNGGDEYYYSRGSANVTGPKGICVGSIGVLSNESRAEYSNIGSRIDIFSPGTWIISSVSGGQRASNNQVVVQNTVSHPQDSDFKILKFRGTSMASPQVSGVLACILENNPRMSQQDCKDYLTQVGTSGQIYEAGVDSTGDEQSLRGAPNLYLRYKHQRETQGYVTAQLTNNVRKSSGMMFPRRRHI